MSLRVISNPTQAKLIRRVERIQSQLGSTAYGLKHCDIQLEPEDLMEFVNGLNKAQAQLNTLRVHVESIVKKKSQWWKKVWP